VSLSIEAVASLRAQLWDAGLRPIEIYNPEVEKTDAGEPIDPKSRGKVPRGSAWQKRAQADPPDAVRQRPVPHALNTGLWCGRLRPIDIDIDNPTLAQACRAVTVEMLGEAPIRIRAGSPRCTILYRAADGEPAKRVITGTSGKVEILGRGQQFVAFGTHYTGAELEWFPERPGEARMESLPAVTETQITELLDRLAPIIGAAKPQRANGEDHGHHDPQADFFIIAAAVADLPNDGPPDWETWNNRLMQIWAATGASPAGREIARLWSARNAAHDEAAFGERWKHYRTSPPTKTGAGPLLAAARRAREVAISPTTEDAYGTPPEKAASLGAPMPTLDPDRPKYGATPFTAASLAGLQPYDWVYPRTLVVGYFTLLGAPAGLGKTALTVQLAVAIALGRNLLGADPSEARNVWVINLEDSRELLLKLVWACCQFHGVEPVELEGKLFLDSGRDRPLIVSRLVDDVAMRMPVVGALTEELRARQIGALFVDPIVDTHSLPENDNVSMNAYCAIWNEVAEKAGCAVMLAHHFRKGGIGGDADAFRGAGALIGKARVAISLANMSAEEAQKLGVEPSYRLWHIRLDNAKRNLAAPPTEAEWLRLESVDLATGDSVQALRRWYPPSPFGDSPMAHVVAALRAIDAGPGDGEYYASSRKGGVTDRWCGVVVMRDLGKSEEQAARIVDQWLKSGVLLKGVYHSPAQRKEKPCVRTDPKKVAEMAAQNAPPDDAPVWEGN
jgi:hypothetical protein